MTIDIPLMIMTAIIGLVMWMIEHAIYAVCVDTMPRVLLIGLLFMVFALVLLVAVHIHSNIKGIYEQNVLTGGTGELSAMLSILLAVVLTFLLAMLFQWIYGLDLGEANTEPTSYIFLIDDSGSMELSDPTQERYKAIADVLEGQPESFNYMVYGFSNDTAVLREMGPISDGIDELSGENYGGTEIKAALNYIMDDYDNGAWDGGENPKVVLLTDGYATDIGFFSSVSKTLRRYVSAHITVSTVGLGDVDTSLMNQIANTTGGVFVDVSDAADLSEAMSSAARESTSRDLLSERYMVSWSALYGVLRVLFLSVLGSLIGIGITIAYGLQDTSTVTILSAVIESFVGALIMEIGTVVLGLPVGLMWLILWILIAITLAQCPAGRRYASQRQI